MKVSPVAIPQVAKTQLDKHKLTIMNELGQIIVGVAVSGTSFGHPVAQLVLTAVNDVYDGRLPLEEMSLDKPLQDGAGVSSLLPALRRSGAPVFKFTGDVLTVDLESCYNQTSKLDAVLRRLKADAFRPELHASMRGIFGFDTEREVTYFSGAGRQRVALIQIASENVCMLVRIITQRQLPTPLFEFLCDDNHCFTGVKIKDDLNYLSQDYGKCFQNKCPTYCDLATRTKAIAGAPPIKEWGLKDLSMGWLGSQLDKSIRCDCCGQRNDNKACHKRWARPLVELKTLPGYIQYAANDAAVGWHIFARSVPGRRDKVNPTGVAVQARRADASMQNVMEQVTEAIDYVGGAGSLATDGALGDENADADADADGELLEEERSPVVNASVREEKAMMDACQRAIVSYAESPAESEPLRIPTVLTSQQRQQLHVLCEQKNLVHITEQVNDAPEALRQLVVTKAPDAGADRSVVVAPGGVFIGPGLPSLDISSIKLPAVNKDWATDPCHYDTYHFLGIFLGMVVTKTSVLFPIFTIAIAMCVFKPMPGEYARVVHHMKYVEPELTMEVIARRPWWYFRKRMRMICPDPMVIMTQLVGACIIFSHMVDPVTDHSFLAPDWW